MKKILLVALLVILTHGAFCIFADDTYIDNGDGTATKQTVIPKTTLVFQLSQATTKLSQLTGGRRDKLQEIADAQKEVEAYDTQIAETTILIQKLQAIVTLVDK